ncbi:MAG: Hemoglobin-like protein HbN (Modular protein) (modular protein) [Deltaproteobacteria bacterium]|nr:Hemoglobin-like protein HbN (Modular protein) (modular protein) [Deltaproteobacteria bacterium]
MRIGTSIIAALAALTMTAACGGGGKSAGGDTMKAGATEKPLYDRLGGKDAITAVVNDFVANVVADARVNAFFKNADAAHLTQMLIDQVCSATGGPCEYKGKDMKTAHTGLGVKEADFNAVVEDLVKSLDKFKVGEKEKTDLLTALGGMKGDIVAP